MSDFYSEFSITSQEEWLEKVSQDLKGKKVEDVLQHSHPIENIDFKSYAFPDDEYNHTIPGVAPYLRGGKFSNNDWQIINAIENSDAKSMNKLALDRLMNGATGLRIDLSEHNSGDLSALINDIGFTHIVTTFIYHNKEQFEWLKGLANSFNKNIGTAINASDENFGLVPNMRNSLIDGAKIQSTGGNVTHEIAYCLHEGHKVLHDLVESEGCSIDEAAAQIKFKVGVGGNYFFEIAKLKTLRSLWYNIVNAYSPEHSCSTIAYVEAETGFVNKSLKDPNTNLLRQTTEALSAIIGGVDELTILPYNWKAKNADLAKSQRLSTNIALILKEESYMDKVIDPSGGAYSQEKLISTLHKKAWELFLNLEKEGTYLLKKEIKNCASKRIELVQSKENTLIGVNKYFNSDGKQESWVEPKENEFGKELILELECNITVA
jgi:methylmalonyl-CoA mutase